MIRAGPACRGGVVPVKPLLIATIRFFGRYKSSNAIRDGVLIGLPRLREEAQVAAGVFLEPPASSRPQKPSRRSNLHYCERQPSGRDGAGR